MPVVILALVLSGPSAHCGLPSQSSEVVMMDRIHSNHMRTVLLVAGSNVTFYTPTAHNHWTFLAESGWHEQCLLPEEFQFAADLHGRTSAALPSFLPSPERDCVQREMISYKTASCGDFDQDCNIKEGAYTTRISKSLTAYEYMIDSFWSNNLSIIVAYGRNGTLHR